MKRVIFSHAEINSLQYLKNLMHEQNLNHRRILRGKSRDWAAQSQGSPALGTRIRARTAASKSSHCGHQEDASRVTAGSRGRFLSANHQLQVTEPKEWQLRVWLFLV